MSKMIINEPPILFQKSLAMTLGVNEAIFIQQLHYWLLKSNNVREGRKWVYKTHREWIEQDFPFFSESTLKRIIASLKESGVLRMANYNKMKQDKTLWYTIDYDALEKLGCSTGQTDPSTRSNGTNVSGQTDLSTSSNGTNASGQTDPSTSSNGTNASRQTDPSTRSNGTNASRQTDTSIRSNWTDARDQNDPFEEADLTQALPIDYTENTQENTHTSASKKPKKVVVTDDIKSVVDYLNEKACTRYTYDSAKTVSLLKRLFKQKRTVDEMKQVIDVKCAEWFPQVEMRKYLRPRTLFGDKFEDYLHQASIHQKNRATNQLKERTTKEDFEAKMLELYGERWRDIFEES